VLDVSYPNLFVTVIVQEYSAAEAEEKSQLTIRLEDLNLTVQRLSADCEAKRAEIDSIGTELQQAKLTLDVSRAYYTMFFKCDILCCIVY